MRAWGTHLPERVVNGAIRRPVLTVCGIVGLTLTSLLWWVWWNRAVTFRAEKEQIYHAWQKSEDQLQHAMLTIDQMTEQPQQARPALLQAKQFYEHLLENGGPPARMALAHYRLGKIHERLGDQRAAQAPHQKTIAAWAQLPQPALHNMLSS